jgi:hypothetical protein
VSGHDQNLLVPLETDILFLSFPCLLERIASSASKAGVLERMCVLHRTDLPPAKQSCFRAVSRQGEEFKDMAGQPIKNYYCTQIVLTLRRRKDRLKNVLWPTISAVPLEKRFC